MKQFLITPASGKRLIGKALAKHPALKNSLDSGNVIIIAGTTNGYVAEEVLNSIDQAEGFSRQRFFRGITLPPWRPTAESGRMLDTSGFPGDVVITNGIWQKGKTIFDVVDDLKDGDVILKGANALDPVRRQAAIYIGDTKGGTTGAALQAVVGRRVQLILPVGLEKRTTGDLNELAIRLNGPGLKGPRLLPVPGQVFTEIDAISLLTGAKAELVAGGGVCGAEGSIWLLVSGNGEQEAAAEKLIKSISWEPGFEL
ncbi:MAG TPA: hypothetical protein VN455_08520 [Methanotrichaceae archaeon]|nr:hypothetical protein [Methanotrichaceae archaeon]